MPQGSASGSKNGSDVDDVAVVDVVAFDDDVAEIDTDPQNDFGWRSASSGQGRWSVAGERAMDGIDDMLNSTMVPSPISLTTRPIWAATAGSNTTWRCCLSGERALLVDPHRTRIADHVGCKDRRELTVDAIFGHGRFEPSPEDIDST